MREAGRHRTALRERFIWQPNSAGMDKLGAPPWPDTHSSLALEVASGAERSRHAYMLHVTDAGRVDSPANGLHRGLGLPVRGLA